MRIMGIFSSPGPYTVQGEGMKKDVKFIKEENCRQEGFSSEDSFGDFAA